MAPAGSNLAWASLPLWPGPRWLCAVVTVALSLTSTTSAMKHPMDQAADAAGQRKPPIMLDRSGGFPIGGVILKNPANENQTLSCDHGYMEYFVPYYPRQTALVMWHSSSAQVWQNRWDGGEGYKDMFLRKDYPVFLWDGPRVGRANYPCVNVTTRASFRDQGNFGAWNFGPRFGEWWGDVQFPADDEAAWQAATSSRYLEFDTGDNVRLQTDAAAVAADSGRLGESIVYLTNSAAGFRAQLTATKANGTNIKGIVAYESVGYVYPESAGVKDSPSSGFGPFVVPDEEFRKLAKLKAVQFVWGDHRDANSSSVRDSKLCAAYINSFGGNAEVLMLGDDAGLKGSTHIPFADMDNERVGGLLDGFLLHNGLDGYQS